MTSRTKLLLAVTVLLLCGGVFLLLPEQRSGSEVVCLSPEERQAALVAELTFDSPSAFEDYISPALTQGAGEDATVSVTDAPDSEERDHGKALKLEMPVSRGAGEDVPSRVQLHPKGPELSWRSGDEQWYGISMYFDEDWDLGQIDATRGQFAALFSFRWRDIAGDENGPGSGIVLESIDGVPHFVANRETQGWEYPDDADRDQIDLGPVVTGRWIDFVVHMKWSASPDGALREYWRDGRLVGRSTNQNMGTDETVIHRMGLYQGTTIDHERTLYWDDHRIGSSLAAVNPACSGEASS